MKTKRIVATCGVAVLAITLGAGAAFAQSADRMSRSIAAAKSELDAAAANYAAVPAVRDAQEGGRECFQLYVHNRPLGDLSPTQLNELRQCIYTQMTALLDRMIAMKSLQRAARFDYAVFSETTRLLTVSETPAAEALSPFVAMLRAAQGAATDESERTLLAELTPFAEDLQARFQG